MEEDYIVSKKHALIPQEIRCIAFQDRNNDEWEWSAVALEMDLWGFGHTMEEARKDLEELIETQFEFAIGRDETEILNHPTEQKWFDLWEKIENATEQSSPQHGAKTFVNAPINISRSNNSNSSSYIAA